MATVERSWVGGAFAAVSGATAFLLAHLVGADDGWLMAAVVIIGTGLIYTALVSAYRSQASIRESSTKR